MKVLRIQQNSPEWLEFRLGKSGGSGFGDLWSSGFPNKTAIIERLERDGQLLSSTDKRSTVAELAAMLDVEELVELKLESERKKRYYEMIAEQVARPITPNDYVDRLNGTPYSMMARGHVMEMEIAKEYEEKTGRKLDEGSVVWVREDDPNSYISPDRAITDKDGACRRALEIKAPESWKVIRAWKLKDWDREEYEAQVIKYFVVNDDLEILDFCIGTDVIPGLELQIFEIRREEFADKIAEAKAYEKAILLEAAADVAKITELGF